MIGLVGAKDQQSSSSSAVRLGSRPSIIPRQQPSIAPTLSPATPALHVRPHAPMLYYNASSCNAVSHGPHVDIATAGDKLSWQGVACAPWHPSACLVSDATSTLPLDLTAMGVDEQSLDRVDHCNASSCSLSGSGFHVFTRARHQSLRNASTAGKCLISSNDLYASLASFEVNVPSIE